MFTTERERKLQGFLEKVVKEREKNGLNVNCNNCMRLSAKGKKKSNMRTTNWRQQNQTSRKFSISGKCLNR